jgi:hypothetical protein
MIEMGVVPLVVKTGNLQSMRIWADVRDAVRAQYMLVPVAPISGSYNNVGGTLSCTVEDMLN